MSTFARSSFSRRTAGLVVPALVCLLVASGCRESTPAANGGATAPAAAQQAAASGTASANDTPAKRQQNERWTDANGVEYIGDVPLDVFYDQPLRIVVDSQPVAGAPAMAGTQTPAATNPPPTGGMGGGSAPPPETTTPEPAAAAGGWEAHISADIVKNEINEIRSFMNQNLQSLGSYKRSMLMIPPRAASLAVMAGIAEQHPAEITWKDDAKYIRNLAGKMNAETLLPSKKVQGELQVLFENIVSTLDRSRPADLEEPPEDQAFPDVAEMSHLMTRMEIAQKKLQTEASSEAAFGSKQDMIRHEVSILGTMAHVATLEGYGYADDEEFLGYAKNVVDAARSARDALDTGDFGTYELSLSKISTNCQSCHSVYRE